MQEFIEPTEQKSNVPIQPVHTEQDTALTEQLIAEAKEVILQTNLVIKKGIRATFGAQIVLALLFAPIITLYFAAIGVLFLSVSLILSLLITSVHMIVRIRSNINQTVRTFLERVHRHPSPELAPFLIQLLQLYANFDISQEIVDSLNLTLLKIKPQHAPLFEQKDIKMLNFLLADPQTVPLKLRNTPPGVINVLQYVGDETTLLTMRRILAKPPSKHDTEGQALYNAVEAAFPHLEARLSRENAHKTLLRPAHLDEANTLLRPSEEQADPESELLRPLDE